MRGQARGHLVDPAAQPDHLRRPLLGRAGGVVAGADPRQHAADAVSGRSARPTSAKTSAARAPTQGERQHQRDVEQLRPVSPPCRRRRAGRSSTAAPSRAGNGEPHRRDVAGASGRRTSAGAARRPAPGRRRRSPGRRASISTACRWRLPSKVGDQRRSIARGGRSACGRSAKARATCSWPLSCAVHSSSRSHCRACQPASARPSPTPRPAPARWRRGSRARSDIVADSFTRSGAVAKRKRRSGRIPGDVREGRAMGFAGWLGHSARASCSRGCGCRVASAISVRRRR